MPRRALKQGASSTDGSASAVAVPGATAAPGLRCAPQGRLTPAVPPSDARGRCRQHLRLRRRGARQRGAGEADRGQQRPDGRGEPVAADAHRRPPRCCAGQGAGVSAGRARLRLGGGCCAGACARRSAQRRCLLCDVTQQCARGCCCASLRAVAAAEGAAVALAAAAAHAAAVAAVAGVELNHKRAHRDRHRRPAQQLRRLERGDQRAHHHGARRAGASPVARGARPDPPARLVPRGGHGRGRWHRRCRWHWHGHWHGHGRRLLCAHRRAHPLHLPGACCVRAAGVLR